MLRPNSNLGNKMISFDFNHLPERQWVTDFQWSLEPCNQEFSGCEEDKIDLEDSSTVVTSVTPQSQYSTIGHPNVAYNHNHPKKKHLFWFLQLFYMKKSVKCLESKYVHKAFRAAMRWLCHGFKIACFRACL